VEAETEVDFAAVVEVGASKPAQYVESNCGVETIDTTTVLRNNRLEMNWQWGSPRTEEGVSTGRNASSARTHDHSLKAIEVSS